MSVIELDIESLGCPGRSGTFGTQLLETVREKLTLITLSVFVEYTCRKTRGSEEDRGRICDRILAVLFVVCCLEKNRRIWGRG